MSKNGGYKILDLEKVTVPASDAEHAVVNGIYEAIEGTRKPILISGLHTALAEYPDTFAAPVLREGDFEFNIFGITVTVTDDDEIYYTVNT